MQKPMRLPTIHFTLQVGSLPQMLFQYFIWNLQYMKVIYGHYDPEIILEKPR